MGDKSTLQLAVERLSPDFSPQDIYISTNILYIDTIRKQLPQIPEENNFLEPEKKDVAPAIALVMGTLYRTFPHEPIAILWSDHLVKKYRFSKKYWESQGNLFERIRITSFLLRINPWYESTNLGYIHTGKVAHTFHGLDILSFEGFKYRPDAATAKNSLKREIMRGIWDIL